MDAAQNRAAEASRPRLTPEQAAREREIESLQLSRTRVLQDLAASTNPRYREMLNRSLAFLDEKIATLQRS